MFRWLYDDSTLISLELFFPHYYVIGWWCIAEVNVCHKQHFYSSSKKTSNIFISDFVQFSLNAKATIKFKKKSRASKYGFSFNEKKTYNLSHVRLNNYFIHHWCRRREIVKKMCLIWTDWTHWAANSFCLHFSLS